jgi:hypothetical protein
MSKIQPLWLNEGNSPMNSLSTDLLRAIFQELDAVMLCRLSSVSKDCRVAADDDSVWDAVHGFAKGKSFEILLELGALSLSKTEECNAAATIASNSEFDGSTEDESEDAIGRRDRAYEAWDTLQTEQRIIRRTHAIAYRMLRVPKKLRVAAADALVHYYKVTQCIDSILKGVPRCSDDDIFAAAYRDLNRKRTEAEHALIDADSNVKKWEHSFVDHKRCSFTFAPAYCVSTRCSSTYTASFCCAQQPWGTSPPLENLEQSWIYE